MRLLYVIWRAYSKAKMRFLSCSRRWRVLVGSSVRGTDVQWPRSAKCAVPIRVDGLGQVIIEPKCHLGYALAPRMGNGEILLQARNKESVIEIGMGTTVSNNLSIIALQSVHIGAGCQIGDACFITDCDFHEIDPATRNRSAGIVNPVHIGDNVWLGSRVMVLKGVTIGDNTVVAAGSVVVKSLPANVLAAGVPAKAIRAIS